MVPSAQMPRRLFTLQRRGLIFVMFLGAAFMPALLSVTTVASAAIQQPLQEVAPPIVKGIFTVMPFQTNSEIARENQLPGTTAWELDRGTNTTFIQGYAGMVSAEPGQDVPLYISSLVPSFYDLNVYRIGWYGGKGGRLVFSAQDLFSRAQGVWRGRMLIHCSRCTIDPLTHLVSANWRESFRLHIGSDWESGVYLIKLSVGKMAESYIPLVVRDDDSHAAVLVDIPVNTYQAYNLWGGYSLYQHAQATLHDEEISAGRATKVSFDRPYDRAGGAADFLYWDIHTVRWLERSEIDAVYTTDVDVAADPSRVLQHQVYLVSGHDEYWTKSMRDGVEAARDKGVNLMFLGGNDIYWQARLEPDAGGVPNRTLVCYKVESKTHDPSQFLSNDPMWPNHPDLVTTRWRDWPVNRPENSLLGLMYNGFFIGDGRYVPDLVIKAGPLVDQLVTTAGLKGGEHIHAGVLGYEYDTIYRNGATPPNLVVLAASPVFNTNRVHDTAYSAYYIAPSGAMVFDAGTIWWSNGLDDFLPPGVAENHFFHDSQAIANLTANILHMMLYKTPYFITPSLNPLPLPPPGLLTSP